MVKKSKRKLTNLLKKEGNSLSSIEKKEQIGSYHENDKKNDGQIRDARTTKRSDSFTEENTSESFLVPTNLSREERRKEIAIQKASNQRKTTQKNRRIKKKAQTW